MGWPRQILVALALSALCACSSDEAQPPPAPSAGGAARAAVPARTATEATIEVCLTDENGNPVRGAQVHWVADIDWANPTPELRKAQREHWSDHEALVATIGEEASSNDEGVVRVGEPKEWVLVVARKGERLGELTIGAGAEVRHQLTLRPVWKVAVRIVDRAGKPRAGVELRVRYELAGDRSVIQPLGATDSKGEIDLADVQRTLGHYEKAGDTLVGLAILPGYGKPDLALTKLDPKNLPREVIELLYED